MERRVGRKDIGKAYGKYAKKFTPKPKYFSNAAKAFVVGGTICVAALWLQNSFMGLGVTQKDAGTYVTLILIATAQLLTGLGVFDVIAKFAGAGVIVPITGFANSMVAPAIEYKKEGPVLGVGANMFKVAGPVIVFGLVTSTLCGIIFWTMNFL